MCFLFEPGIPPQLYAQRFVTGKKNITQSSERVITAINNSNNSAKKTFFLSVNTI